MGFTGFAVDLGYLQYQQRQQQSAVDAAAIAGAQAIIAANTCPDQSAAQTSAANDSAANGFSNGVNGVTVLAINPPSSGPFESDSCAVQVNVTSSHATWFSKIFGFSGKMTTTATAAAESNGTGCVYFLNPSATVSFSGSNISVPNCGILDNGNLSITGSNFTSLYAGYAGTYSVSGSNVSPSPQPMLPVSDPCPSISGCNYLTNNPPATPAPTSGCASLTVSGQSNYVIPAGCYNSITVEGSSNVTMGSGAFDVGTFTISGTNMTIVPGDYGSISAPGTNLTLDPGFYIINGTSLSGSNVTGSGLTIYATTGGVNFTGSNVTLSPCTTTCTGGAVSNVLYYQVPSDTTAAQFAGSNTSYGGLIYAPGSLNSTYGSNSNDYSVVVFGTGGLSGSNFNDTGAPAGQSLIKTAVLAL